MNQVHFMIYRKQLFARFLQLAIKQKLSSVQKNTWITSIAYNKTISVFCVSGILYSPRHPAAQIKWFLQLGSIISWNPRRKSKKANQQLYVN